MKKGLFLFGLLIFSYSLYAQQWLWGRQGHSESDSWATAADNNGNAYFAGTFSDTISFGNHLLSSVSSYFTGDSYIVKYDKSGNLKWVNQTFSASSASLCAINGITTDLWDNVYITGNFCDTVNIGAVTLICPGNAGATGGIFIVKYDSSGNVLWARQTTSIGRNAGGTGLSVSVNSSGDVYITGYFSGNIFFGATELSCSINATNTFLAKYDANGSLIWVKQSKCLYSQSFACSNSVFADISGGAYMTGYFADSISFGNSVLYVSSSLMNSTDAFIAKYDGSGNLLWAKQSVVSSSNNYAYGNAVVADDADNAYIGGTFSAPVCFGSYNLSQGIGANPDIFLTKYSFNGDVIWAEHARRGSMQCWALAIDECNKIYMSANAVSYIIFGGDTIRAPYATTDASIIMKIDSSGKTICGSIVGIGGDDNNGVACSASGEYVYLGGDFVDTITVNKDFLHTSYGEEPFVLRWQPCICSSSTTACCNTIITEGGSVNLSVSSSCSYLWSPSNGLSCTTCQNPIASPTETTTYYVYVTENNECTAKDSVTILVQKPETCDLFVPNAFSPNGDGQNDILFVRGDCINTMEFLIFDRWGNKVFESENQNEGWDGKHLGLPMNTGTYVWYFKATMQDGSLVDKKGSVELIR